MKSLVSWKKQNRRRRRRRLCWPGKEEDIISHSEHTRTHLASSEDLTYSNLKRTEIIISFSTLPPSPSLSSPTGDWGAWQITPWSWFSSWGPATYPIPINRWGLNYKNYTNYKSAEGRRQRKTGDWSLETGECSPVSQTLLIQKPYRLDLKRVEMMAYVVFVLFCVSALVAQGSCSSCLQTVQHLSAKPNWRMLVILYTSVLLILG